MPHRPTSLYAGAALALLIALAGCGESAGTEEAAAPDLRDCEAVGTELEQQAIQTIEVELHDHHFSPSRIRAEEGVTTFVAINVGDEEHELAFLPGGGEVPLDERGRPDEDALAAAGAFELEAFGPGQDCSATYRLDAGEYTIFCIVRSPDGETHLAKGMEAHLVVG